MANSTISGNSASFAGGIYNRGTTNLANSISANNIGTDFRQEGTVNTLETNIVEDGSLRGDNVINADPNLSPLQDNGGATETNIPLEGSPAIDAGNNDNIPSDFLDLDNDGNTDEPVSFDQRGGGFLRVVNDFVDIGAVETGNNGQNNSPQLTSPAIISIQENTTFVVTINGNDPDGDNLNFTLSGGNDLNQFILNSLTNELTFSNPPNFENPADANRDNLYEVQVTVEDENGATDSQNLQVTVTDVDEQTNQPPSVNNAFFNLDRSTPNNTLIGTIAASDPDGDSFTYTISDGNADIDGDGNLPFTLNNNGQLTVNDAGDLNSDAVNTFSLQVVVNDSNNLSDTAEVTITLQDAPAISTEGNLIFGTSQADNFDATDSSSPYTGDNQIVFSGQGDDTVNNIGAVGNNRIYASFENDFIIATQNDRVFGQDGDDEIIALTNNLIFAGNGNDIIEGTQVNGDNIFHGQGGDDQIFLGGFDRVFGGIGEDLIFVQAEGGNTITGGPDADDFWVATGGQLPNSLNIITDFTSGEDKIGFGGFPDLSFNDLIVNQNGENTIIGLEDNPSIAELQGVQGLNSNDFIFI